MESNPRPVPCHCNRVSNFLNEFIWLLAQKEIATATLALALGLRGRAAAPGVEVHSVMRRGQETARLVCDRGFASHRPGAW